MVKQNHKFVSLRVFDQAAKSSAEYKMYFTVVPEGYGDAEPTVQIDFGLNGTQLDSDTITLSGTILDGAEQGDVYVEAALDEETFDQTAVAKYTAIRAKVGEVRSIGQR